MRAIKNRWRFIIVLFVINLVGGIEGSTSGWKKANLPLNYMFFIKDLDPRYIYPPDVSDIPEEAKNK